MHGPCSALRSAFASTLRLQLQKHHPGPRNDSEVSPLLLRTYVLSVYVYYASTSSLDWTQGTDDSLSISTGRFTGIIANS